MDERLAAEIERAAAALERGRLVVYPTETLYGLGADAGDAAALERLAALKGRDRGKPVSVLVASRAMLDELAASVPDVASRLIEAFWPGPLTIALAARPTLSRVLTGSGGTIAARISSHPVARALVERLARPLTSTSANPGGEPPPADTATARRYFGDLIEAYVDAGPTAGGPASTVLDCSGSVPRLVREGAISAAAIEAAAGMRLSRE